MRCPRAAAAAAAAVARNADDDDAADDALLLLLLLLPPVEAPAGADGGMMPKRVLKSSDCEDALSTLDRRGVSRAERTMSVIGGGMRLTCLKMALRWSRFCSTIVWA